MQPGYDPRRDYKYGPRVSSVGITVENALFNMSLVVTPVE